MWVCGEGEGVEVEVVVRVFVHAPRMSQSLKADVSRGYWSWQGPQVSSKKGSHAHLCLLIHNHHEGVLECSKHTRTQKLLTLPFVSSLMKLCHGGLKSNPLIQGH